MLGSLFFSKSFSLPLSLSLSLFLSLCLSLSFSLLLAIPARFISTSFCFIFSTSHYRLRIFIFFKCSLVIALQSSDIFFEKAGRLGVGGFVSADTDKHILLVSAVPCWLFFAFQQLYHADYSLLFKYHLTTISFHGIRFYGNISIIKFNFTIALPYSSNYNKYPI